MIDRKHIQTFVTALAERFHPQQVVLFGSYAYGKPTPDSDVDLLVIMKHNVHPAVQAARIRKQVRAGFPMDLLVQSPGEVRKRLARGDSFITDVLRLGKTLYEKRHA